MAGKLGIIADDLTGACDAGVEFAARGFSCMVSLDNSYVDSMDVRVISTETRLSSAEDARSAVKEACERLSGDGARVAYKKIDSTMRGNCRAEIDAVMETLHMKLAFVAPAFPEMNRRVSSGWLSVDEDSARSVYLPAVLGQSGVRCLSAEGPYPDLAHECGLFIVDAATREELGAFARHYQSHLTNSLFAGSAGLAAEIASLLSAGRPQIRSTSNPPAGPLLFLVGTTHPNTLAQLTFLKEQTDLPSIPLTRGWEALARILLDAGQSVVLSFDAETNPDLGGVRELVARKSAAALVLSGGHTAKIVCKALGARAIRLWYAILPGVPLGSIAGGIGDGLLVMTKSGGFGKPDLFHSLVRSLAGAVIQ